MPVIECLCDTNAAVSSCVLCVAVFYYNEQGPARPTAPVSTAPATPPVRCMTLYDCVDNLYALHVIQQYFSASVFCDQVAAPVRSGASAVGVSLRQVGAARTCCGYHGYCLCLVCGHPVMGASI